MDLAGAVAVIDGELYPLRECDLSREVENSGSYVDPFDGNTYDVVTGESISGSLESYRSYDFPHVGAPNVGDMYIFPPEGGTHNRFIVKDAIVSGIGHDNNMQTHTIDFVAMDIETDG